MENTVQQSSPEIERLLNELAIEHDGLNQQNSLLQTVIAGANIAPWRLLHSDGGRLISPSFARMLGYGVHELSDSLREIRKTVHPDDFPNLLKAYLGHIRSRGVIPFLETTRFYHKNGEIRWIEVKGQIANWDPAGEVQEVAGCMTDVTTHMQKQAELYEENKMLRQEAERIRRIYAKTPIMMHSIDREGRLIRVSDSWLKTLGYSAEEVIGQKSVAFLTRQSQQKAKEHLADFFESGYCVDVPYQMVCKDGRVIDTLLSAVAEYNENGELAESLAVIINTSEKMALERSLKRHENRLQRFYQAISDHQSDVQEKFVEILKIGAEAMGTQAGAIGRVVDGKCQKIAVYDQESLLSVDADYHPTELFCSTAADNGQDIIAAANIKNSPLGRQTDFRTLEIECYVGLPLMVRGEIYGTLFFADSRPRSSRFSVSDLNFVRIIGSWVQEELEKQEYVKALETKARELAQSNQDLQQFAYIASHDLQEPLRTISNFAELLTEKYQGKLDERGERYLNFIGDGVEKMRDLIDSLLMLSRVGSKQHNFKAVNMNRVLGEVYKNLKDQIRSTGALIDYVQLPKVLGVSGLLEQLMQNLISNALKFCEAKPPQVGISAEMDGEYWRFAVRDNGIGIAPEFTRTVFQLFQRLHSDRHYKGNGMGLTICQRIVENHGGRIWVESEPGQGSTFYFTLRPAER